MSKYPPGYIPLTVHSLGGDFGLANGRSNSDFGRGSNNNGNGKRQGQRPKRGPNNRRNDSERPKRNISEDIDTKED